MGLDAVELVLAVEDAFQLAISDEEAERIRTPRQLVDHLTDRLAMGPGACLEQRAFYRLRRGLRVAFGKRRREIGPQSRWEELLPRGKRREQWKALWIAADVPGMPSLSSFGRVPQPVATLGGTARWLAREHPALLKATNEGWRRSEVEATVRRIVCETLNIAAFGWDQRFVEDLDIA